jgi:hypothetical protein
MIGYRVRRFLDAWAEAESTMRAFLLWNASNTLLAFALAASSVLLLVVTAAPGFQRTVLFGHIAVAVAWTLSVFVIGPVYERVGPPPE